MTLIRSYSPDSVGGWVFPGGPLRALSSPYRNSVGATLDDGNSMLKAIIQTLTLNILLPFDFDLRLQFMTDFMNGLSLM